MRPRCRFQRVVGPLLAVVLACSRTPPPSSSPSTASTAALPSAGAAQASIVDKEGDLLEAGLVELPPTATIDRKCASYSEIEWVVSKSNGGVRVTRGRGPALDAQDPLPFAITGTPLGTGSSPLRVTRILDGWLVSESLGEFGGSFYWFSPNGDRSEKLAVLDWPPDRRHDDEPVENVRGFAWHGPDLWVITGLNHLGGHWGGVLRLVQNNDRWALAPFAKLDGYPTAWVDDGDTLFVLTSSSLSEVTSEGAVHVLAPLDTEGLAPTTMVQSADRAIYVGMQFFVLKLQPSDAGWVETWFVPKGCERTRVVGSDCECLP